MAKKLLVSKERGKYNENNVEQEGNVAIKAHRKLDSVLVFLGKETRYIHDFYSIINFNNTADLDIDFILNLRL